ncbi:MAG: hypothetical protein ACFFAN_12375 [Promethearchaeota archaeon]
MRTLKSVGLSLSHGKIIVDDNKFSIGDFYLKYINIERIEFDNFDFQKKYSRVICTNFREKAVLLLPYTENNFGDHYLKIG